MAVTKQAMPASHCDKKDILPTLQAENKPIAENLQWAKQAMPASHCDKKDILPTLQTENKPIAENSQWAKQAMPVVSHPGI